MNNQMRTNLANAKYGNRSIVKGLNDEIDTILKEQQQFGKAQISPKQENAPKRNYAHQRKYAPLHEITLYLENGASLKGQAVKFNLSDAKILVKDKNEHTLFIDISATAIYTLREKSAYFIINNITDYLLTLHKEASLEFPAWLERYGTRAKENDPFYNLDEIREEYKHKKFRFGLWRIAVQIGFFNGINAQNAEFNKIVNVELNDAPISDNIQEDIT
jgi:hypothetical protein